MSELDVLRYPIGRFAPPASSLPSIRAAHIQTLRRLPERLRAAVAGLNDDQLDTPYREGGWTVRQVVHHVADSHANAYIRFKLALTEEWPTVKPYDEAAWALLSDSANTRIETSLCLLDCLHVRWVTLMRGMTGADWARTFRHPALGPVRLDQNLALYAWHGAHHVEHVRALRRRMGW